jgi:hypothetical protein
LPTQVRSDKNKESVCGAAVGGPGFGAIISYVVSGGTGIAVDVEPAE